MSLVILAVHDRNAVVCSDGAQGHVTPDGSVRRARNDVRKFEEVGKGFIVAGTGVRWTIDRLWKDVSSFVDGSEGVTFDDVAAYISGTLPSRHLATAAQIRADGGGAERDPASAVALVGFDSTHGVARLVTFGPPGYGAVEMTSACMAPFADSHGVLAAALQGADTPEKMLLATTRVFQILAPQHEQIGGQIFVATISPPLAGAVTSGSTISGSTSTPMVGAAAAKVTTIAGTGVTDVYTKADVDALFAKYQFLRAGVQWTLRTTPAVQNWQGICYGGGMFVAVAQVSGGGNQVMKSPDGVTWTTHPAAAAKTWFSVCYGNGTFVALAENGTTAVNAVMTSPDGVTWTAHDAAVARYWWSVCFGNGLFVAVANFGTVAGNRVMTSPDGATWTARTSASDNEWTCVTYGNGLFVAVADTGTGDRVMTSPDGIVWTSRTSAADYNWLGVTYGAGVFVTVANTNGAGGSGGVMTSTDGISWTLNTTVSASLWISVCYGGGMFVAVAQAGTPGGHVMTSTDGFSWRTQPSAPTGAWVGVAAGPDLFVAVAQDGNDHCVMTAPAGQS